MDRMFVANLVCGVLTAVFLGAVVYEVNSLKKEIELQKKMADGMDQELSAMEDKLGLVDERAEQFEKALGLKPVK